MDDLEEREDEAPSIRWREVLGTVIRRRRLIAIVFTVGVLASAAFALTRPPVYGAAAKLRVTSERAHVTVSPDPGAGATVERLTDQDLNAEVELLRSPALLRDVLATYGDPSAPWPEESWWSTVASCLTHPGDVLTLVYQYAQSVPQASWFDRWVRLVGKDLTVTAVTKTNLIEVSFLGDDPQWAARLVNDLASHHAERHAQLNRQSEALRFLEGQRALLSERVRQAEQAVQQFYRREGLEAAPDQLQHLQTELGTLDTALRDANTQIAEGQARIAFLEKEIRVHPASLPGEPMMGTGNPGSRISGRVLELELQRSQSLSKFAPTSLMIQDIDRQLAEARALLAQEEKRQGGTIGVVNPTHQSLKQDLAETQAQQAALRARVEALNGQIASTRATLQHLDAVSPEHERLLQEVASTKEALGNYLKKVEAARFSNAMDESRFLNVTVVEPAEVPSGPLPTKTAMLLGLGAAASLLAAVGLALLLDRLDPAVKCASEAERISGLTVLADIRR